MLRDNMSIDNLRRFDEKTKLKLFLLSQKLYQGIDEDELIKMGYVGFQHPIIINNHVHISDMLPLNINQNKPLKKDTTLQKNIDITRTKAIVHGKGNKLDNKFPKTLAEMFITAVHENPESMMIFYDEEGKELRSTYKEIYENAIKILSYLTKIGIKQNDKLILQFSSSKDFVENFWACMLGGIVIIPLDIVQSTDSTSNQAQLLKNIWRLLECPYIIASKELYEEYIILLTKLDIDLTKIIFTDMSNEPTKFSSYNILEPDDLAMIFFTSGSTGLPKGVTQTNKAACMQIQGSKELLNFEKDVMLNWMPLEHPGGCLMAHSRAVLLGSEQILVDKGFILGNPLRWLDLIDKHNVVYTWAPHFAYALINEKTKNMKEKPWDLSSVKYFVNGGEMIDAAGAKFFLNNLKSCKLKNSVMVPVWGMAETCSGTIYSLNLLDDCNSGVEIISKEIDTAEVMFSDEKVNTMTITEIGIPIPGMSVRIVDGNDNILQECIIGRFQVKGPSVTQGYFCNDEANNASYTSDGWFNTGDIGFVHNGKVFLTGREKDIIIVNGLNYNNVEIESIIESSPSVLTSYTAVCTVRDDKCDTDKIVVFYVPTSQQPYDNVRKEIKQLVFNKIRLTLDYIIPVDKSDIPKTNLNKIQRSKLSKKFINGEFNRKVREIDLMLQNSNTIPSWFYTSDWFITSRKLGTLSKEKRYCFFVNDINDIEFFSEFNNYIIVMPGKNYEVNGNTCTINYSDYNSFLTLLTEIREGKFIVDTLVYMIKSEKNSDRIVIEEQEKVLFYGLVNLCKAIANTNNCQIELNVVTHCLYEIIPYEKINYTFGNVPGFIRCLEEEIPKLRVRHIDIDSVDNMKTKNELIIELSREHFFDRIVGIRSGKRYSEYLEKIEFDKIRKNQGIFAYDQLIMVTGGLGGIGFELCKYLLRYYNSKIIIIGRTNIYNTEGLVSKKMSAFTRLKEYSDKVLYYNCSVDNEILMKKIIKEVEMKFDQKLDMILHCAGLGNLAQHFENVDKTWIKNISISDFNNMNLAKIKGTLSLYNIAKEYNKIPLVLFSSTNSFFGSATFSAYSSANSFVDNFAKWANKVGEVPVKCLNFSTWKNVGMSEGYSFGSIGKKKGLMEIDIQQGLVSIDYAIRLHEAQVFIGIDGSKDMIRKYLRSGDIYPVDVYLKQSNTTTQINYQNFRKENIAVNYQFANNITFSDNGIVNLDLSNNENSSVSIRRSYTETEKKLMQIWKDLLKIDIVKPTDDFYEIGGKSLIAAQLAEKIRKVFNISFPLQKVFTYSIVSEMAQNIDKELHKNK